MVKNVTRNSPFKRGTISVYIYRLKPVKMGKRWKDAEDGRGGKRRGLMFYVKNKMASFKGVWCCYIEAPRG
jgi:hypothetical protein